MCSEFGSSETAQPSAWKNALRAATPRRLWAVNASPVRGNAARGSGRADRASRQRRSMATATGSSAADAWKMPLRTRCWLLTPSNANSRLHLAASVKADESGRLTRISVVNAALDRAATVARYNSRCLCSPASGPKTRSARGIGLNESGPGRRERQQSQGVPGGSRIENHMIEIGGGVGIAQEPGELVEGSDLDRARAGKLLLHAGDRSRGQHPAVRPDDPLAVLSGRFLGINVEGEQARNRWHGRGAVAQRDAEHLVQIGCRVGAHQEHPLLRGRPTRWPWRRRAWSFPRRPCP